GLAFQSREQTLRDLVIADEMAAIDIAISHAVLQGNAPLPARFAGGCARVGCERPEVLRGYADRTIARQPARPFVIARLERLLDEQATKAGAVDEEVAFDRRAALHRERLDPPVLTALANADDLALDALDAAPLGKCA